MSYPHGLTLAEVSKKSYTCKKCSEEMKYAKFFKSDNKLLTVDGKEPNGLGMEKIGDKWVNHSNVFSTTVLVNEGNKLHECYKIEWPDLSPKSFPESDLKMTDTLDTPKAKEFDVKDVYLNKKVIKNFEPDGKIILAARDYARKILGDNAQGQEVGWFATHLLEFLKRREDKEL